MLVLFLCGIAHITHGAVLFELQSESSMFWPNAFKNPIYSSIMKPFRKMVNCFQFSTIVVNAVKYYKQSHKWVRKCYLCRIVGPNGSLLRLSIRFDVCKTIQKWKTDSGSQSNYAILFFNPKLLSAPGPIREQKQKMYILIICRNFWNIISLIWLYANKKSDYKL